MATRATTRAKTAARHEAPKVLSLRDQILKVAPDFKDKYGKVQVCYVAEAVFGSQRKSARMAVSQVLDNAGIPRLRKIRPKAVDKDSDSKPIGPGGVVVRLAEVKHQEQPEEPSDELISIDVLLYVAKRAQEGSITAFELLRKLV